MEEELQYDVSVVVESLAAELAQSRVEVAQLRGVIRKMQEQKDVSNA